MQTDLSQRDPIAEESIGKLLDLVSNRWNLAEGQTPCLLLHLDVQVGGGQIFPCGGECTIPIGLKLSWIAPESECLLSC